MRLLQDKNAVSFLFAEMEDTLAQQSSAQRPSVTTMPANIQLNIAYTMKGDG